LSIFGYENKIWLYISFWQFPTIVQYFIFNFTHFQTRSWDTIFILANIDNLGAFIKWHWKKYEPYKGPSKWTWKKPILQFKLSYTMHYFPISTKYANTVHSRTKSNWLPLDIHLSLHKLFNAWSNSILILVFRTS